MGVNFWRFYYPGLSNSAFALVNWNLIEFSSNGRGTIVGGGVVNVAISYFVNDFAIGLVLA